MPPRTTAEASRHAADLIRQVESLVIRELPAAAGTVTTALDLVRADLAAANAEVERLRRERQADQAERQRLRFALDDERLGLAQLRQLSRDLERLHAQDEARLAQLERERAELAEARRTARRAWRPSSGSSPAYGTGEGGSAGATSGSVKSRNAWP